jgi:hypothetical protein
VSDSFFASLLRTRLLAKPSIIFTGTSVKVVLLSYNNTNDDDDDNNNNVLLKTTSFLGRL